ncbi:MAG: class I SAM-dependent methyltransferase [Candidatus Woesearchaeota archaeon]
MSYNSISQGYNELHSQEQQKKLALIKHHFKVKKSDLLLDVGCGTGISSDFDCKVIGVDSSFEMLRQSKKQKVLAFAEALPFKDKTFDIVVSVTAIHNFKNKKKALLEIRRVGKSRFVFTVLRKSRYHDSISALVRKLFKVKTILIEDKDSIFFAT